MDPLSITASIIAILQLSSKVIGYLNDVKDAPRDRARCAVEATNLHSLLTNLRFRLEEGDASTQWFTAIKSLATMNGPLDQFKQVLELLQARMTGGRGRFGEAVEVLIWRFKKEEIDRLLQCMERLKTLIGVALQMDHFKLSKAIKDDMSIVRSLMPTVQAGIESIKLETDRAQLGTLRAWISPTDFVAQQSDILRRRHEGTGQWFLDSPEFIYWLSGSTSNGTLLCTGIPGAGKTMLAAVTIDHISAKVRTATVGIAWLYCSYKSRVEQTVEALLQAILQQLVRTETPSIVQLAKQLQQLHNTGGSRPTKEELLKVLGAVFAELMTVYIIVDALDECPVENGTRHQLMAHVNELKKSADVRLMVTSRHIPDIVEDFRGAARIEIRAHDQDIKLFISGQLDRFPRCVQLDAELQLMVQERVIQATGGMFLLARLYVDSLLDKRTKSKVRSTLETLSTGVQTLERAYKDAMERLQSQLPGDVALAMRALTWIVYAEEALTTTELCHALAVEIETADLDTDNILDVGDIVSVCVGFVTIDEDSNIVRLVHYTMQEFFERTCETWNPRGQFDIAHTCLTYLSFEDFRRGGCTSDATFQYRLTHYPFFYYAARKWGFHASSTQDDLFAIFTSVAEHEGISNSIAQALYVSSDRIPLDSQVYPIGFTSLHIQSYFGLHAMAEKLLGSLHSRVQHWMSRRDSYGRSALHVAAIRGHESMVRIILERSAELGYESEINMLDDDQITPLQFASRHGHVDVVRLLLEKGADLNMSDRRAWTPIILASAHGHLEVVRTLMLHGADVFAKVSKWDSRTNAYVADFYGWGPVAMAANNGHREVVDLLLSAGSSSKVLEVLPASFLFVLIKRGSPGVRQLISSQFKMHLDILDQHGRNLLHVAVRHGRYDSTLLLTSIGFDLSAVDKKGDDVLCLAASSGSLAVLNAVLDKLPAIPKPNKRGWSPLHWACRKGAPLVIERLVRIGVQSYAPVALQSQDFWSPIDMAVYHGQSNMLQDLSGECRDALGTITKEPGELYYPKIECDGCQHLLYGACFHCRTCFDFDYCFMCKPLLDHLHKGHGWIVLWAQPQLANANST